MDAYITYVHALLAQTHSVDAVRKDLLSRGLDPQTIDWLIQTASQPDLPRSEVPSQVSAPAVPSTSTIPPQLRIPSWLKRHTLQSPGTIQTDEQPLPEQASRKGYALTILLCLIPTLFIMFDAPFATRFGTHTRALLTVADIAGMVGLVLYVIDMILATRFTWLEDIFGGLSKVYIAHAIIGGSALVAILIHPILIAVRYLPLGAKTVAGFFLPSTEYIASAYGVIAVWLMLVLIIITLYTHLPYRMWLWTHKFLGVTYLLICLHVLYEPNAITNNFFLRWYLILFVVIGLAAFVYRTLLPNILVRRYLYTITGVKQKATGVIEIALAPTNRVMQYRAGQFVFISFHADGISSEWHPFTIVTPPGSGSFSIDVKSLGAYTETMTRLLPSMQGMSALIEGAYGRFTFHSVRNTNQVWIAGGIGVTPFLSMAQSLGRGPYNIDLYYVVRSEAELIDADILARQQSAEPDKIFRVIPFVTQKYKRHLTVDVIQNTSGDLSGRDFLICGPQSMMDDMKQQLLAHGVKSYKIHSEEFAIT